MTLIKLVQNYFELHNSFVGINKMPYYTLLQEISDELEMDVEELCYMFLGFVGFGGFSAKDVFELSVQYLKDGINNQVFSIMFPKHKKQKALVSNSAKNFNEQESIYKNMIVKFITDSNCAYVNYNNKVISFSDFKTLVLQAQLFSNKNDAVSVALDSIKFKWLENQKICYVSDKFISIKSTLTESKKEKILKSAVWEAIYGEYSYPKAIIGSVDNFIFNQFNNQENYAFALICASAVGKTYKEFASDFQINIVDQSLLLENLHHCLYYCNNVVLVTLPSVVNKYVMMPPEHLTLYLPNMDSSYCNRKELFQFIRDKQKKFSAIKSDERMRIFG